MERSTLRPLSLAVMMLASSSCGSLTSGGCGEKEIPVDSPDAPTVTGLSLNESVELVAGQFPVRIVWEAEPRWERTASEVGAQDLPDLRLDGHDLDAKLTISPTGDPRLVEQRSLGDTRDKGRLCPGSAPEVRFEVDLSLALDDGSYALSMDGTAGVRSTDEGKVWLYGHPGNDMELLDIVGAIELPVAGGASLAEAAAIVVTGLHPRLDADGWQGELRGALCEVPGCDPRDPKATIVATTTLARIVPR